MKDEIYKKIAEMIRKHRTIAKLTQKQLADLAGVGKTVVFDIEHAKPTVQLDTLVKICDVLNVSFDISSPLKDVIHETRR